MANATLERIGGSALRFLMAGERERPRALVLLLHGSGADCYNMLDVAEAFARRTPDVLFVVPNAPKSYAEVFSPTQIAEAERARPGIDWEKSRTWVPDEPARASDWLGVVRALHDAVSPPVRALSRLADLLLARYGLGDDALAIYGFSQGGLLAVHLGIARERACAAVVCHSGQFLGTPEPRSRPRTLVIVGSLEMQASSGMSQVYPITVTELRELGIPLEEFTCEGLGHGVNDEVVDRVSQFMNDALPPAAAQA